jgi:hypothetical protein
VRPSSWWRARGEIAPGEPTPSVTLAVASGGRTDPPPRPELELCHDQAVQRRTEEVDAQRRMTEPRLWTACRPTAR